MPEGLAILAGASMFSVLLTLWMLCPSVTRKRVGAITFYSVGAWRVSVCRASKGKQNG
jgi:hypothetical protein